MLAEDVYFCFTRWVILILYGMMIVYGLFTRKEGLHDLLFVVGIVSEVLSFDIFEFFIDLGFLNLDLVFFGRGQGVVLGVLEKT